ncbi:hypothetical protein K438DRAFT_1767360 [Mycena galopus ATCC 62051]|nr:hypothetical protein K438DRAFT_1767360 [Mycena galopus ATCC 62051]
MSGSDVSVARLVNHRVKPVSRAAARAVMVTAMESTGNPRHGPRSTRPLKSFLALQQDGTAVTGTQLSSDIFASIECLRCKKVVVQTEIKPRHHSRQLPAYLQPDHNLQLLRAENGQTWKTSLLRKWSNISGPLLAKLVAEHTYLLHGRDGRVSTGRGVGNPCQSRAVVKER